MPLGFARSPATAPHHFRRRPWSVACCPLPWRRAQVSLALAGRAKGSGRLPASGLMQPSIRAVRHWDCPVSRFLAIQHHANPPTTMAINTIKKTTGGPTATPKNIAAIATQNIGSARTNSGASASCLGCLAIWSRGDQSAEPFGGSRGRLGWSSMAHQTRLVNLSAILAYGPGAASGPAPLKRGTAPRNPTGVAVVVRPPPLNGWGSRVARRTHSQAHTFSPFHTTGSMWTVMRLRIPTFITRLQLVKTKG